MTRAGSKTDQVKKGAKAIREGALTRRADETVPAPESRQRVFAPAGHEEAYRRRAGNQQRRWL